MYFYETLPMATLVMGRSDTLCDMSTQPCIFIVDDDSAVRDGLGLVIENAGLAYQAFESAEHFLHTYCPGNPSCLLLDLNMPGMSGLELQAELLRRNIQLSIIFITAAGDVTMKARALKAGAVDFLTKPVPSRLLIERIQAVLQQQALGHRQGDASSP
ncbi:Nodulation protein W (fragment) [Crenothrix polyspora]|uniref:Nodulation protein W n=2 Tax=Crenothrix polyspora TaxID=360316 RepID=A0A1R4H3G8_9GAMM